MLKRDKDKDLDTSLKKFKKNTRKSKLNRVYDKESLRDLKFDETEDFISSFDSTFYES